MQLALPDKVAGVLRSFTGIDSPYEAPEAPDLLLDSTAAGLDELAERIIDLLISRGMIGSEK